MTTDWRAYMKKRRAEKGKSICTWCSRPRFKNRSLCRACLARHRQASTVRRKNEARLYKEEE